MDDAELVKYIASLKLEDDVDSGEELCSLSYRCRIYSDSEISEAPQDEENHNDTEESLNDFHEVTVTNDKQYESRPSFSETTVVYKHMPPINSKPIQYFNLFFTDEFLEPMKIETNRFGRWFFEKFKLDLPPEMTWYDTTIPELRAFFAVLLEMGITWRCTVHSYWIKSYRHIPWFEQMLSEMRFRLLCKFFYTLDRNTLPAQGSNEYHPGFNYEPVLAHANKTFKYYYSPNQHLSIDGSLLGPKSESTVTQFLEDDSYKKSYPKFWMLNDANTHYCLSIYDYHSNYNHSDTEEIKKTGLPYFIIHKLLSMGDYLMKGYHIVTGKFFTNITLAKTLFKENTFLTGRMHSNVKYIPPQLKQLLHVGEYKYFRNREILLLAYREIKLKRRNMLLLSTYRTAANKTTIIKEQKKANRSRKTSNRR
ncbi:hypothetical protein M0802_000003 [Mischocyttarus mexicanus]|nr:hypothetical protein M0802_000003 [Mischocyttarus mexicanus]